MVKKYLKEKQHILFPILDIALNGLNYFYHVYVSWYLSGGDYGKLNALLSISAILLVLGISFQMTTAKRTAVIGDAGKVFKDMSANGAGLLVPLLIILITCSPLLVSMTRSSYSSVVLIILIFIVNLFLSIFRGMMQGLKRFFLLNISFYMEVISKTAILFLIMWRFKSVNAALITILAGMSISLIHSIIIFRDKLKIFLKKPLIQFKRKTLTFIGAVGISQFALYFFTSVDMIIVNYFLIDQSGTYAVILKYSQLLFFVSFSILTVFIPHLSERIKNKKSFIKLTALCLLLLTGVGLIALLFYKFILPETVTIFFGDTYAEAAPYLILGGISYFLLVLSFVLVNVMLILDRMRFIPVLIFFSFSVLAILLFFHNSIEQVLYINIGTYSLLLVILLSLFLRIIKTHWK